MIKQIRSAEKGNFLTKALFEKYFDENCRSIVVLANPKTVLYDRYAKKEIRQQVIRADQLIGYIRKAISESKAEPKSDKNMELLAQFFFGIHKEQKTDFTSKFRDVLVAQKEPPALEKEPDLSQTVKSEPKWTFVNTTTTADQQIICPKCGAVMIKRKATKGANIGKEFYGCSNYPKCHCIISIQ